MAVFKLHTFTHFICFAPSCTLFLPRLLTESKQAEFTQKARILIQLEKYEDAVSIGGGGSVAFKSNHTFTIRAKPISRFILIL